MATGTLNAVGRPRARPRHESRTRALGRRAANSVMLGLTGLATLLALIPLAWILYSVVERGLPALTPEFFTQTFAPTSEGGGGVLQAIVGTLVLVGLASLLAIPLGILGGFYAANHPDTPFGLVVRFGTDVLSGVPSIVVGLFVYTLLVAGRGYTAISGAVALAIMMLPVVLRTTEEMLKLVPRSLNEASLGLGAPVWKTSLVVLLPAALTGVVTGVLLAIARVSGETAPLLFTAQGNNVMSTDLGQPIAALPLTMFKYAVDPDPFRNTQAWGIALVIVAIVLVLNVVSRAALSRQSHAR
jgi:phosphate transport system permease protein